MTICRGGGIDAGRFRKSSALHNGVLKSGVLIKQYVLESGVLKTASWLLRVAQHEASNQGASQVGPKYFDLKFASCIRLSHGSMRLFGAARITMAWFSCGGSDMSHA